MVHFIIAALIAASFACAMAVVVWSILDNRSAIRDALAGRGVQPARKALADGSGVVQQDGEPVYRVVRTARPAAAKAPRSLSVSGIYRWPVAA